MFKEVQVLLRRALVGFVCMAGSGMLAPVPFALSHSGGGSLAQQISRSSNALVNDRAITINTPADIRSRRQALIEFTWGRPGFPYGKLPSIVDDKVPSPVRGLSNLERIETLHITMDADLTGLAHHFIPLQKRDRLVVLHQGHACTFDDGPGSNNRDLGMQRTINALLSAGFSVLTVFMPQYVPHQRPCSGQHDQMFNLGTTGSPMKFFLEPVAVSLNHLQSNYPNYRDYSMIGLSGGGWTTTVYAALDPRIRLSFPVAGTVPLYLRYEGYQHDKEQYLPSFYEKAGYPDLYVLGSYGYNRKQIQILNRHDDCCFGEDQHKAELSGMSFETSIRDYEARVQIALNNLHDGIVGGFFRLYIDEVAPNHMISDYVIKNVIIPVLNGEVNIVTTIRSVWGKNRCLDIPYYGRPPRNGDPIQIYQCHGDFNQQFRVSSDGTIRVAGIANLCLEVPDNGRPPRDGDRIQVYQCHGGFNQRFRVSSDGTIRVAGIANLCLEVPDNGRLPRDGDPIQIYRCHSEPNQNQMWSVNFLRSFR